MASHPLGVLTAALRLGSSANLLRAHSISLSMSLLKTLINSGANMDPEGITCY